MKRAACALVLAACFVARSASACPNLTVESNERALATLVEEAFATRADIDTCARVVLTTRGRRITIAVTLPDGRTAVRSVSRREDVIGALEALLRMPADEPEAPSSEVAFVEVPYPPLPAPDSATLDSVPEPRETIGARRAAAKPWLGAELGVGTGARVGERSSVGFGAVFLFDVRSYLIGAQGRFDRYTASDETQSQRGASVTAVGGRRLDFGMLAVDLIAGAGLRIEEEQADVPFRVQPRPVDGVRVAPPPPRDLRLPAEHRNDSPEIVFGARFNFRTRSVLRAFLSLDGAVGPEWSFGVMVGAAVGS